MKNNKGFTLIEAIAVTMLLAMLALIIIPNVLNQRRKQEKKIKEQQKKIMYIEAERYLKENNLVEASSTKCIPVTFLQKEGYINLNTTTYDSQYIKLIIDEDENIESSLVNTCSDQVINKVTVTFDANRGTVDTTSKEVLVGKKYGDLPTPTRSGYTFKGWNGKNKFNIDASRVNKGNISNNIVNLDASDVEGNRASAIVLSAVLNGTYKGVLMWIGINSNLSNVKQEKTFTKTNEFDSVSFKLNTNKLDPVMWSNYDFIDNQNYTFSYLIKSMDYAHAKASFTDIQLEEGNKATEYEPYYVTKNTKVTQTGNHTLKAIWKANET